MAQNGARTKKIAPKIGKESKKSQERKTFGPPWAAKIEKKGVWKIDVFFDPLLELTLSHFRALQGPQKQPK